MPSLSISQDLRKMRFGAVSRTHERTCSNADDAAIASFFQSRNVSRVGRRNASTLQSSHTAVITAQKWPRELHSWLVFKPWLDMVFLRSS